VTATETGNTMKQTEARDLSAIRGWLMLILLGVISFSVSCWLSVSTWTLQAADNRSSIAGMLLGEGRLALSGHFYELADEYFHGGLEHQTKEAFRDSLFQKAAGEISPRRHIHLSGAETSEIIPWLRLATMMNPSNVTIYLDTAYWLSSESGRPDLAEQVLLEAQVRNPSSYKVQLERGRLFLQEKRIKDAKQAFNAGLALWPGEDKPDTFEAKDDKASLLIYRALIHEAEEERQEAITCLKGILNLFPERTSIKDRIKTLEEGKEPSLLASQVWSDMLKKDVQTKSGDRCKHPGEE